MGISKADISDSKGIAQLIAKFRVELGALKNIRSDENLEAAEEEFAGYIKSGYPIFIYKENDRYLGYLICRAEIPNVWVESLYVLKERRRNGIASALYNSAEQLAASFGEDTLYNYVHPNNDAMIAFLNKKGYHVLNLIEIRKKRLNEKTHDKIIIGNNVFDY